MENLRECPFCGNKVAVEVYDQNEIDLLPEDDEEYTEYPYYAVVCSVNENSSIPIADWVAGCGATGGYRPTKKGAIEIWNKRITHSK